jgi:hypothetical protein
MKRILVNERSESFDNAVYFDVFNQNSIASYSNSLEHAEAQKRILALLTDNRERLVRGSAYRGEWGGGGMSDDEWYSTVRSGCQSEIARVMALPENERLNMTAILDAKIAVIEAEEAQAARRAAWRRRLSIGGSVLIPLIGIAAVIIATQRRKSGGAPHPRV